MKTFKDLVKGDKIYHVRNNTIDCFIFDGFDDFDAFWGKGHDLMVRDLESNDQFRVGVIFDDNTLNYTNFLNYYTCLESLILGITNGDV